ncbi:MAG: hypothetical protein WA992_01110 [Desulfobulbales bacterium]|jgi:uncharacterized membrane protein YdjX (TVP38/TMEM64 family)
MSPDKKSSSPTIKAFLFVIFIISVILLFRFTPLAEYLHPQALKEFIVKSGPMAPVLFILAYATGICFFLPATLFTGIGAVLFGMALTRVSFAQFFWGTFFGILAGGFVMTFFFATITEVWSNGEWQKLWGWKSLLSLLLFISSFFIPKVVKHFKPEM